MAALLCDHDKPKLGKSFRITLRRKSKLFLLISCTEKKFLVYKRPEWLAVLTLIKGTIADFPSSGLDWGGLFFLLDRIG